MNAEQFHWVESAFRMPEPVCACGTIHKPEKTIARSAGKFPELKKLAGKMGRSYACGQLPLGENDGETQAVPSIAVPAI